MTSTFERLREADPARDLDPAVPEDLLTRLVAGPREPRRRRVPRRLLLVPAVAAAAVLAVPLLAPDRTPPDLAALAYAQSAAPAGEILYVRTTTHVVMTDRDRSERAFHATESWQLGPRWRTVTHDDGEVYEEYNDADGRLHFGDGETTGRAEGDEIREYVDRRAPGFLAEFRRDYERGVLDERGTVEFNGRPAKRFVVTWKGGNAEYFLDAEAGTPLGSRSVLNSYAPNTNKQIGTHTVTTIVDELETLEPTRENLSKLAPDS